MRIDSSGRLFLGTSSSAGSGDSQYALLQVRGNTTATTAAFFSLQRGEPASSITSGEGIGYIIFSDNAGGTFGSIDCTADGTAGSGDYPGRLVFSTTADGASASTERLRIAQSGAFGLSGANYGTSGQVLSSQGSGSAPQWATVTSSKVFAHMAFDSNQSLNPGGYNVSSVTNNAVGKNTVNFTTSHGSTNYSVLCSGCRFLAGTDSMSISYGNMANGSVEIFSAGPVGAFLNLADTSVCILT
jgi:hypothetical protein